MTRKIPQLIADIPTDSTSCGQQFSPSLVIDMDTGAVPATRVKYMVAVVKNVNGKIELSEPKAVTYTSPWVATFAVSVETPSNEPVDDVEILVEHLYPTRNETNPNFVLDLVTDDFGEAIHQIYVTDPIRWANEVQRLRVTPSKCDGTRLGSTCCKELSIDGDSCLELGIEFDHRGPFFFVSLELFL